MTKPYVIDGYGAQVQIQEASIVIWDRGSENRVKLPAEVWLKLVRLVGEYPWPIEDTP